MEKYIKEEKASVTSPSTNPSIHQLYGFFPGRIGPNLSGLGPTWTGRHWDEVQVKMHKPKMDNKTLKDYVQYLIELCNFMQRGAEYSDGSIIGHWNVSYLYMTHERSDLLPTF